MAFAMAPAIHNNSSYIDLTDENENNDSITRTQDAFQRAFEAASRLTSNFESIKPPKPIAYQKPSADNASIERDPLSMATAHQPLRPPPLGTFTKSARADSHEVKKDVVKKDGMNNAIPRPKSLVPRFNVPAAQSAPGSSAYNSGPVRHPSTLQSTERNQRQPQATKSVTPGTDTLATRRPRSAAISAKQNIAQAYSELEKWVDKDPNLMSQQTGISTPRRPARSNDDLEEWSPSSNMRFKEEERKHLSRTPTKSPTPLAGKHAELTVNGDKGLSHAQVASIHLNTKKRKFSGSSQSRDVSSKLARWDKEPSVHYDSSSSNLAESAKSKSVHDAARSKSLAISSSKVTSQRIDRSLSEPSKVEFDKNGQLMKPTTPHAHVNIDVGLQDGSNVALESTPAELDRTSTANSAYAAFFSSKVYPAIEKLKRRHEGSLPQEDLDAIGKIVVDEVRNNLAKRPENSSQLDKDTQKRVKVFVKKLYRKKVRNAIPQTSHETVTPANDSQVIVSTASSSSLCLRGTAASEPILPGSHRPPSPVPYQPENACSNLANVMNEEEEPIASHNSHPTPSDQQKSSPLQQVPDESSTSFFAPNFDRGRYPAMRRRRGNKYYTPTRTPKKTSTFEQSRPASSEHSNDLGLSNDKDEARLFAATASQSSALLGSPTQVTALTTAAGWEISPIQQDATSGFLSGKYGPMGMRLAPSNPAKPQMNIATSQSAQQISRTRPLEGSSSRKGPRPIFCPKPATALDPSLEHDIAVSVTDTTTMPSDDRQKYSITPASQMRLVADQSIVNHVDLTSNVGKAKLVRIETKVVDPVQRPGNCISSLLRNRELGLVSRGRRVGTVDQLHQLKSEMLEPWKNWIGASGDVVAVAWHPDSNVYAFGAAAHTNVEDIQYNRPCNLLLGNLTSNQVRELPDHRIDRPKPETIPDGPNSTQAVYDACDPKVYETVASIAFSPAGDRMYTASHDCTVKIWDVSTENYRCLNTLSHEAWVTSLEISKHRPGLFATASKCVKDAVRIYHESFGHVNISASRAEMRPEWKIYPECLRWGPNSHTSHLLLVGFQQWEQQGGLLTGGGQLCLYDAQAFAMNKVLPSSQSVYAAAWHPTELFFATGGAPGMNVADKLNTKSVVRVWDVRLTTRCHVEYECPATDMQDITFSPSNSNIVTAGCTDGNSYIWDWRWPDEYLHRLKHGKPLYELDHTRKREEADTGVMMSVWGPGGSLYYTGSSDGVIKAWDVRRHPEDVLVSNVANFGVSIQSGAFSPDGNNLLVGDAEGGIHVLSSAPCGPRSNIKRTDAYIELVRASDGSGMGLDQGDDNPGTEGVEAARSLIKSGQLEYHKQLGVGQGLHYRGPYATWARKEPGEGSSLGRLRKKYEKQQPISKRNEKRWDIATKMTSLLYERKMTLDRERDGHDMALNGLHDERGPTTVQSSENGQQLPTEPPPSLLPEGEFVVGHASNDESMGMSVTGGDESQEVENNTISEGEMVEENYWWMRMGEDEINLARAGRVKEYLG